MPRQGHEAGELRRWQLSRLLHGHALDDEAGADATVAEYVRAQWLRRAIAIAYSYARPHSMRACVHSVMYVCIGACVYACVYVCVQLGPCACMSAYSYVRLLLCSHVVM